MEKAFVLGLVGGIFGFIAGGVTLLLGGAILVGGALFGGGNISGALNTAIGFSITVFIGSALGIGGGVMKRRLGGVLMILASILVLVGGLFIFGFIPFILLLIGGIVSVREKPKLVQAQPPMTQSTQSNVQGGMASVSTKYCTNCGKEIATNVKFCGNCGTSIT